MGKSVMEHFNTIQLAVCSNEWQPWSSIVVEEEHGGYSYTLMWTVGSAGRQAVVAGFLCDNTTHLNFVWKLTAFLFFLLLFLHIIRQWYVLMMLIVTSIKISTLILSESIFLSTELLTSLTYIIVRFNSQSEPAAHIITTVKTVCIVWTVTVKQDYFFGTINRVNWSRCHNFVAADFDHGKQLELAARARKPFVGSAEYVHRLIIAFYRPVNHDDKVCTVYKIQNNKRTNSMFRFSSQASDSCTMKTCILNHRRLRVLQQL